MVNMKQTKKEQAVTLIALVITIVILIILAVVSINMVLGDQGIFKKAQQAANSMHDTEVNTQMAFNSITDEMDKIIAGNNTQNPELTGPLLKDIAKPGDYVKYVPAEKKFTMKENGMSVTENGVTTNYTQIEEGIATGYDTEQTYNTSDYTGLWQVLYNDEEHGIQIISAGDVTNGQQLYIGNETSEEKAKQGYNSLVDTLNGFCSNYVDAKYATNGRCVGSNPINPSDKTNQNYELPFEYNGSTISGCKIEDENYLNDYNAMTNIATEENPTGIHNIGQNYYLASRKIAVGKSTIDFSTILMNNDVLACNDILRFTQEGIITLSAVSYAVRPCITLNDDIKIINGNGTSNMPYELIK